MSANKFFSFSSTIFHFPHCLRLIDIHSRGYAAMFACNSLRSTLGERFVIFGDPVVDGIPVHARREDSRFLVTWTGDVQNLRHFE